MLTSGARHELYARGVPSYKRYSSCTASLLCFLWHCRHWLQVMLLALYYLGCGTGRCL